MKVTLSRQFILEFLLIMLLLLPMISFVVFLASGFFFNFNNFNFIVYLVIIILSFSYMRVIKKCFVKFFLTFGVILILMALGFLRNGTEGVVEFLRAISGYYTFVFLGWVLYKVYYETGKIFKLLKFIVNIALFISIINIAHFILLQTDNYTRNEWTMTFERYNIIVDYLMLLNKIYYDYIVISAQYNEVGFIRHVGYFFDTHSQYYIPLAGCIILVFTDKLSRYKWIYMTIMLLSVLFSGIKTAYMTIALMFIISLIGSGQLWQYIKRTLPIIIAGVLVFRNKIIHLLWGDGMWKILFQLFSHVVLVPMVYFNADKIAFFIGGAPQLRNDPLFYSEVFWVTVTFYIGVLGLLIYLKPIKLFKYIRSNEFRLGTYMYIMFCFSMTHYGVYCVGVNNLISALPIMYYFAVLRKEKREKHQMKQLKYVGVNEEN